MPVYLYSINEVELRVTVTLGAEFTRFYNNTWGKGVVATYQLLGSYGGAILKQ